MINEESVVKLELVQINGIANLLLSKCDLDVLELRVNNIRNVEIKDVKKAVHRLSRKELIEIIQISSEINDDDITKVYELNRYGLRPGFTICYLGDKCRKLDKDEIKSVLVEQLAEVEYEEDEQYKQIAFRSIEAITNDTIEISLSYLAKHSYLSEEEKPEYIYEYKETFVWINISEGYLAFKTAPNKIVNQMKNIFSRLFSTKINLICLTRRMIDEIFGENRLKKGTYYKPNASDNEAQKVTISDSNLSEKPNVRSAFGAYDMTASSLEEDVNEEISSTLGINCKKGRIYLSKNLNASDFRAWSVKRIKDIIHYINGVNLESKEAFEVMNPMDNRVWTKYTVPQKNILSKILFCIYCMKKNNIDSLNLECTTSEILLKCDKLFMEEFMYELDENDDFGIASCADCGSTKFCISKNRKLTCKSCGNQQDGTYDIQDESGQIHSFLGIEKLVTLIPSNELIQAIVTSLNDSFDCKLEENETFYIRDGILSLLQNEADGGHVNINELIELDKVNNIEISIEERTDLLNQYNTIKEKCASHKNDACNVCSYEKRRCIMSLFSVFNFRPSPHQNSEFGDVNFSVTYEGKKQRLVGIAKSKNGNDTLSVSTKEAREMIQQTLTMSHDKRADIIAVICPMRFHPQLQVELEYIGKVTGKKIIYFDDEFMARLLKYNIMLEKSNKK